VSLELTEQRRKANSETDTAALLLMFWLLAQSGGWHSWCWQPNDGDAWCGYDSYNECLASNEGRAGVCLPRTGLHS
jgi:hypothetical protein